jgi:dolichyl-phosphate beta-glucosyltransferase
MPERTDHTTDPALSLVIPAYNEAARLDAGFQRLSEAIAAGAINPDTTQFIVVDDGSTDQTSDCAKALYGALPNSSVIRLPQNRGKGAAIRAGVTVATGTVIAFADADMAIDPIQTPKFVAALHGHDLAIGSRAASGASVDRPSIRRSVMNRTFNRFVNTVTHVSLDDTQCGFKAFRGPAARLLFHCTTTERMAFDVELLVVARTFGLTISQVPVHWLRVEGSRVRSWSDGGSMVRDVLRARQKVRRAPALRALPITLRPNHLAADLDYLRTLGTQVPVVHVREAGFILLFPLMTDEQVASRIGAVSERLELGRPETEVLSLRQLQDLSPLSLSWDNTPTTSNLH